MSSTLILSIIAAYFLLLFLISYITGKNDSNDRTGGTVASVIYLLSQGVQIFRVHNVNEIKQGILVFKRILMS